MTGTELREARRAHRLRTEDVAVGLGVSDATVRAWERLAETPLRRMVVLALSSFFAERSGGPTDARQAS